jgi:hypothetical protein
VRKLTRRLGAEVVHEITRELIHKARREKRFRPRGEDRLDRCGRRREVSDRPCRPPAKSAIQPRTTLLPDTAQELRNLGIKLKEIMVDGAFTTTATNTALEDLADTVHIAGRQEQGSRRTHRRRQRYRTGTEGRVSHLKRGSGLRHSRLKGNDGHQIWDGWAILTYNADAYAALK